MPTSYKADRAELIDETIWQRGMAVSIPSDPEPMINLGSRAAESQRELFTTDEKSI